MDILDLGIYWDWGRYGDMPGIYAGEGGEWGYRVDVLGGIRVDILGIWVDMLGYCVDIGIR